MRKSGYRVLMLCCQEVGATTGSGVVASELVHRLASRGNDVTLLYGSNNDPSDEFFSVGHNIRVDCVRFNSNDPGGLPFPVVGMSNEMPYLSTTFSKLSGDLLDRYIEVWKQRIRREIDEICPNIIHVNHLWLLAHIALQVALEIPVVVSLHGTEFHRVHDSPHIRDLIAPSFKGVRRFFSLTQRMVQEATKIYDLDARDFVVLGNGFASEKFFPLSQSYKPLPILSGFASSVPLIVFAGKFARWKGLHHLLNAFSRLVDDTSSCLMVAGTGPDLVREEYLQQAAALGLENRVCFLGHLKHSEVATLLNKCHVFVLPSFHEPFGLILLEAIACGCRIVAAKQGGPAEFVPLELKRDKDAILVSGIAHLSPTPHEAICYEKTLADAIRLQLMKPLDSYKRRQISASVAHLSWEHYVDKLTNEYEHTLSR